MTVHFIGAGPGAADLLTLRGRDLIAACEVCLYAGSLVPEAVLAHCPEGARVVNTAPMDLDEIIAEIAAAGVDTFVAGQVFGDVALLADEPRQTNAVALRDTTLMAMTREGIANVNLLHPFIASRLFLNLARDVSCRWVDFIARVRGQGGALQEREEKK